MKTVVLEAASLQAFVDAAGHNLPAAGEQTRIVASLAPLPESTLLDWLHSQLDCPRLFFRDRNHHCHVGLGVADSIFAAEEREYETALDLVSKRASNGLVYLGGTAFDPGRATSPEWKGFGAAHFVLPRLQIIRDAERTLVSLNLTSSDQRAKVAQWLTGVRWRPLPSALPDLAPGWMSPGQVAYSHDVSRTVDNIREQRLEKLVLAARKTLPSASPLGQLEFSSCLLALAQHTSQDAYLFFFQPHRDAAFVGASPEQLFRRAGANISADALAGTRRRGDTKAEDDALARQLLRSGKDQREQAIVVEALRQALAGVCDNVDIGQRVITKQTHVQHLWTQLHAHCAPEVTDIEILTALHPTPAVCGAPAEPARQLLARIEPFDRGWYAGAFGYTGGDSSEFAVAIRSALLHRDGVHQFAGCGVVADSDPQAEWLELGSKLRGFSWLRAKESHRDVAIAS